MGRIERNRGKEFEDQIMSNLVPLSEIEKMASYVAASRMFPGIDTKEKAAALMLLAQSEELHPMQALKRYHMMEFKNTVVPTLKADVMLANFQEAGGTVEWKVLTDDCVTGVFTHAKGGTVSITWDNDTVKKAGLGNLHHKYPRAMKRSRCIAEGVRTVFPSCLHGMHAPEEVVDIVEAEVVQPPKRTAKKVEAVDVGTGEVKVVEAATVDRSEQVKYAQELKLLSELPSHLQTDLVSRLREQHGVKKLTEITKPEEQYEVLSAIHAELKQYRESLALSTE